MAVLHKALSAKLFSLEDSLTGYIDIYRNLANRRVLTANFQRTLLLDPWLMADWAGVLSTSQIKGSRGVANYPE